MSIKIHIKDSDLASRHSAATLRACVERQLRSGKSVLLDLSVVQSVSESYADELLGVLIEHYSLQWVFSRLKVIGAKPAVVRSITSSIRYRLERDESLASAPIVCVIQDAVRRHEEAFA